VDADVDPMYPAAYDLDNIISVAATDHNDQLAYFSNYGANSVDLGAPGVDVYSTLPTYLTDAMWEYGLSTEYGWLSGTSMATPHVAGVAALLRDLHPEWPALQVKDQLLGTVDSISALAGISVTGGRLNAVQALTGVIAPRLRVSDKSITEGDEGSVLATFTVTLSAASTSRVVVKYSTGDGTAIAGTDYTSTTGFLRFVPGETSKTFTVPVLGDRLAEPTETFSVVLSNPENAGIADGLGVGSIIDNEPLLSIGDMSLTEGNAGSASATFTVTLSASSTAPVSVVYATSSGSATAGVDYTPTSGTLTFEPGATSKALTVSVTGDRIAEADETFFVELSNSSNAGIAASVGVGTITDDEPRIGMNNVSLVEGANKQTTLFTFTITLSVAYDQELPFRSTPRMDLPMPARIISPSQEASLSNLTKQAYRSR
jgi:hypothetical protein